LDHHHRSRERQCLNKRDKQSKSSFEIAQEEQEVVIERKLLRGSNDRTTRLQRNQQQKSGITNQERLCFFLFFPSNVTRQVRQKFKEQQLLIPFDCLCLNNNEKEKELVCGR
jgi:hypothetical protein